MASVELPEIKIELPIDTSSSNAETTPNTVDTDDSIFGFEENENTTDYLNRADYDEWANDLYNRFGMKGTRLGKNETTFAEYAGALNDEVKQDILSSYNDQEGDKELSARVQAIYVQACKELGKKELSNTEFEKALRRNGLKVDRSSKKTSYIIDYKKGAAGHGGELTNGAISMFTITAEDGTEIKIADTNGNGSIELEEVLINELLSGIASDIDINKIQVASGGYGSDASTAELNPEEQMVTDIMANGDGDKAKYNSGEYQEAIRKLAAYYINENGMCVSEAMDKAKRFVEAHAAVLNADFAKIIEQGKSGSYYYQTLAGSDSEIQQEYKEA